ncbi:sedoheptulokinase-like [Cimex lectularius]|uniref:Sedoheptulokinase n=1 Tax=Cimex lectularius TaxID=79782 RepID=A0A8I6SEG6_CIMLE|nr:sedoheptulokinase-like [Cimex lectularius]
MGGMGQEELILGIDIGTTSVKVGILNAKVGRIIARQSKDTQANVPSELGCEGNKQNPPKIMSAMHACISRLSKDLLKQVSAIGICGQMHGVMLWNYTEDDCPWEKAANESRYDILSDKVSSLYTWQDSRCDPDFLASLPQPKSHLKACSGYGCNTLFWISKNRPEKLKTFNCAGTIQDFAVAMLCELKKPVMSVQNAASWGYFDTNSAEWNTEILDSAGFPVELLPKVVPSGEIAGRLTETWHSIPAGTPVVAALGDLQCSVLSALKNDDDAVLNISTSAQMSFIAPSFDPNNIDDSTFVEFLPYFEGRYLAVAAALNGGNVLATFISMLQKWTLELGSHLPQSTLWEKVIESASKCETTSLVVKPKILGERHSPKEFGSVININAGNVSLGQVFKATCTGVINNLHEIMPRDMLLHNNISRILGVGSALSRNKVLQEEVKRCYQLPIVFEGKGDAAFGAAMVASKIAKS